ncbi:PI-actitoxin-Axm2b-like [Anoplophora glabripennis]|uniref:PI-actitoxin-Axm2b-like n=1 Tax=Anoplophora glabripennis TaxID=217634 RepID=UPI000873D4CA|nr:PI-actitoxin-Axm2b-like [Anoplophora glabripennis]
MLRFFGCSLLFLLTVQVICFNKEDCHDDVSGSNICDAYFMVFRWNDTLQKCVSEFYEGCKPTKNNFHTIEQCQKIAEPVCKGVK